MELLSDRIRLGLTDEQKCDILYQLLDRATEDGSMPDDAAAIEVDQDCTIKWDAAGQHRRNMALWPPELISVIRSRQKEFKKEQKFYIAGMLGYLMSNGKDWFEEHSVPSICTQMYAYDLYVIQASDVRWSALAYVIAQLTAVDPARRKSGVEAFVAYAYDAFPSVNEIRYVCEGRVVGTERVTLTEDLQPTGKIVKFQGMTYRVNSSPVIAARPGRHAYNVPVTKITPNHTASTGERSANPWDADPNVWSVWVSLAYLTGRKVDKNTAEMLFSSSDTTTKIIKFQYSIGAITMPSPRLLIFKGDPHRNDALKNRITITKPSPYSEQIYYIAFVFTKGWNYFEYILLDQNKKPIGSRQKFLFEEP